MDKEFFINPTQFDQQSTLPTWQSISTSMEILPTQSSDSFLTSIPASDHFGTPISNDALLLRELIGKLGNICNSNEIIKNNNNAQTLPSYIGGATTCSNNNSSPKMGLQMMESVALGSTLPAMPGDPGFAERAARFSSLGSRSFNGRTPQFGGDNSVEFGYRSNNSANLVVSGDGKLQRVCSSPSLNIVGNSTNEMNQSELVDSRENSSVSGQNPSGEKGQNRKRKASPKGKSKEYQCKLGGENGEESNAKRSKSEEGNGMEKAKTEENRGDEGKKPSNSSSQKPPEPPKDYIHVRARRGQATDSHSLAERVRREKISERMKLLQDLVPGCNKVTGKALMLDEIINYVQSLQRQVEFLSMKLASVNPRLEFNVDNLLSKDHVIQPNCSMPHPMYPIQPLAPTLYGQPHQNALQNTNEGSMTPFSMDTLNPISNQNHFLQLPPIDGFPAGISQLSSLCEGDLQSIVQMSYGQRGDELQSQHLHGSNQTSLMKIEL